MLLSVDVKETVSLLHVMQGNNYIPVGACFYNQLQFAPRDIVHWP